MRTSISGLFLLFSVLTFLRAEEAEVLTEKSIAGKINWVGCDLLRGLYKTASAEENILVSPVNIYAALALLNLGANDKTRDDLDTVMKISGFKNPREVHHQLKEVLSKVKSKQREFESHETLLTNGIFLRNDFPVKDSYLELVSKYYDGQVKNLDFAKKPQEATDVINNWISNSTKGRIGKFYGQPISIDTVTVLISTLYFNARWKKTFEQYKTIHENFNTSLNEIKIPMMHTEDTLHYVNDHSLQYESVSLPYSGREYEMNIYLPHQIHRNLSDLYHQLMLRSFDPTNGTYEYIDLKIPKMKFSFKNSVVNALNLETIFQKPNLTEMTSFKNLKISDMIHATELEVDEKGTIATAVTVTEFVVTSIFVPVNPPIKFYVNRPFVLTIKHIPTQTILFGGIVRKPIKS